MRRLGHAGRVDGNHAAIVSALRKIGCRVWSTAPLGRGFPDLLVLRLGRLWLFEVKFPGEKLNDAEVKFHSEWRSESVCIVRSVDEAIALVVGR